MHSSPLNDEPAMVVADGFSTSEPEFEIEVEEKKPRGRPKKVVQEVEATVNVKNEKARLAQELTAQKAFSKAQPFQKQWTETINGKIIRFTRTHNGNVFRDYVGKAEKTKKRA